MQQTFSVPRVGRGIFFAVCLGVTATIASAQVPNFQKLNEKVYRGAQPSSDGFKYLAGLGVKTVIDLRLPDEHSQADEEKWVKSDGMQYLSIPLRGLSAPPDQAVSKILAILNDPSAGPVFVHCRKGADRTGTILACYRISHDHWENRKALEEARGLGMSVFERAMRNYVLRYKGGDTPGQMITSAH
jgi:tyrosine-protein phosphatase SIW14